MKKRGRSITQLLLELTNNKHPEKEITYEKILKTLGDQAFGMVLLFFSLPGALPFSAIPGVSLIFSIPIVIFAFQMLVGRETLWLPKFLARRTVRQETLNKFIHKTRPYLSKIEYFLKPRFAFMTNRFMEILNALVILCLAFLLMLPIPFSNFILGLLLVFFSLGLTAKDGFLLVIAHMGTIIYLTFVYVLLVSAVKLLF